MKKILLVGVLASFAMFGQPADSDNSTDNISPVPEPATMALMGAGLAAVGFAAWRKNRKR